MVHVAPLRYFRAGFSGSITIYYVYDVSTYSASVICGVAGSAQHASPHALCAHTRRARRDPPSLSSLDEPGTPGQRRPLGARPQREQQVAMHLVLVAVLARLEAVQALLVVHAARRT